MFNQITIYDLMCKESDDVDINSISEEEMVGIVSRLTGTDFIFSPLFGQWEAVLSKPHSKKLSLHFDNYAIGEKERFISCGYSFKHGGGGSPLDSIDEAVAFFQKKMKTLTSSPLDW